VDKALANGQITPRQHEQIALAVAEINSCSYSLSIHYTFGHER
jgi:AhpD family alkylhydroperoxidase